jgi:hypothetical protein
MLAAISGVYCIISGQTTGWGDVMTASAMATAIFFATTGLVLIIMGKANLPKLHFDEHDKP